MSEKWELIEEEYGFVCKGSLLLYTELFGMKDRHLDAEQQERKHTALLEEMVRKLNACEAMAEALRRVVLILEEYVEDEPHDEETLKQARAAFALYRGHSA